METTQVSPSSASPSTTTAHPLSIEWWGTAAFRIQYGNFSALLDPYFTRNPYSRPSIHAPWEDLSQAKYIFVSHGHFDHISDIPKLRKLNPSSNIFAPKTSIETIRRELLKNKLPAHDLFEANPSGLEAQTFSFSDHPGVQVQTFKSGHVHFDLPLIATSLWKAAFSPARQYLTTQLLTEYPCGETLAHLFSFDLCKVLFLGSAGPSVEMLDHWSAQKPDVVLVPLQGNSRICEIGADITLHLRPKMVIPHHHDNFYPPVSKTVDIKSFKKAISKLLPQTRILELRPGEKINYLPSGVDGPLDIHGIC